MTMPPSSDEVLHGKESLLPELGRYLIPNRDDAELYDLHHPLLITLKINLYNAAWVNALYRNTKARVDAALAARDVDTYVLSHERPYRFEALTRCVKKSLLTESDYWPMVAWVWIDSNNIYQNHRRMETAMVWKNSQSRNGYERKRAVLSRDDAEFDPGLAGDEVQKVGYRAGLDL